MPGHYSIYISAQIFIAFNYFEVSLLPCSINQYPRWPALDSSSMAYQRFRLYHPYDYEEDDRENPGLPYATTPNRKNSHTEVDRSPYQRHTEREKRAEKDERESMSAWLQRQASSHGVQLAATAVLSGAAVAGAIYGYQNLRRAEAVEELKASIPELDEKHRATKVCLSSFFLLGLHFSLWNLGIMN